MTTETMPMPDVETKAPAVRVVTVAEIKRDWRRYAAHIGRYAAGPWHLFRHRGGIWCDASFAQVILPIDDPGRRLPEAIPVCGKCMMLAEANEPILTIVDGIGRQADLIARSAEALLHLDPTSAERAAERDGITARLVELTSLVQSL